MRQRRRLSVAITVQIRAIDDQVVGRGGGEFWCVGRFAEADERVDVGGRRGRADLDARETVVMRGRLVTNIGRRCSATGSWRDSPRPRASASCACRAGRSWRREVGADDDPPRPGALVGR